MDVGFRLEMKSRIRKFWLIRRRYRLARRLAAIAGGMIGSAPVILQIWYLESLDTLLRPQLVLRDLLLIGGGIVLPWFLIGWLWQRRKWRHYEELGCLPLLHGLEGGGTHFHPAPPLPVVNRPALSASPLVNVLQENAQRLLALAIAAEAEVLLATPPADGHKRRLLLNSDTVTTT